jgi:hypothetical protein
LKERLLQVHTLDKYGKFERLTVVLPLHGQRMSTMLATMLEFCVRGEEKKKLFACLFLQRLPWELRILLIHEHLKDLKTVAAKADWIHTHHKDRAMAAFPTMKDNLEECMAAINRGSASASRQNTQQLSPPAEHPAVVSTGRTPSSCLHRQNTQQLSPSCSSHRRQKAKSGCDATSPRELEGAKMARIASGLCFKH